MNQPFRINEARLADAKAASAAARIQNRPAPGVEALRFDRSRITELTGQQIAVPGPPLNRLKGSNPEAFHYWFQAQRFLAI